jgi:hypothetical protein
VSLADIGDFIE